MGKQMSIRELRAALAKIEHELTEHGEITLTRNGKPIAKIQAADMSPKSAYRDLSELRARVGDVSIPTSEVLDEIRGPR